MRLEQLEARLLLTGTTPSAASVHAGQALVVPLHTGNLLAVTSTSAPINIIVPAPAADHTDAPPPTTANATPPHQVTKSPASSGPSWAIDKITISETALAPSAVAGQVALESPATPHHSIGTAEPLPLADSVLVHGAIPGQTGPDVYRVPILSRISSLEIEINAKLEDDAAATQLDLMDDAGQLVGQLTVPTDASTFRVTLRPPEGSSGASVYVGISGVKEDGGPAAADYLMSVTRQTVEGPATGAPPAGLATQPVPSAADSLLGPAQPSPPRTSATTEDGIDAAIGIPTATDRPVALALPARLGRPMAGLFAFGDAAPAVVPIADTVDLALLELIPEEIPGLPEAGGLPLASEPGAAPAASGELPLITLGFQACEEGETTAPRPSSRPLVTDIATPVSDRSVVKVRNESAPSQPPARRRILFQAGLSVAAAVAFSLLLPEATATLHFARQARRPLIVNGRPVRTEE